MPIEIPKHLCKKNFRFIRLGRHGKIPKDSGWALNEVSWEQQPDKSWKHRTTGKLFMAKKKVYYGPKTNYAFNDPIITKWIISGNNYGVVGGYGNLIGFDADDYRLQKIFEENFKDTLTVKSGGVNEDKAHQTKKHYYIQADEALTQTHPLCDFETKEHDNVGHLRWDAGQLVGPNCIHPNGNIYKILKDVPIQKIETKKLLKVLAQYLKDPKVKLPQDSKKSTQQNEKPNAFADLKISDIVDTSKMTDKGNGELQGGHPLHPSKTGWDCTIDTTKNTWYCFGHTSGGGVGELIAIKHGLLKCSDSKAECLRGDLFKKVQSIAMAEYGLDAEPEMILQDIVPNEIPFTTEKFTKCFEGLTKHLPFYETIESELGLVGNQYNIIKKELTYLAHASWQEPCTVRIGKVDTDNRVHLLLMMPVARGKGIIKSVMKAIRKEKKGDVIEASGLIHPEQLIGKIVIRKVREENDEGKKPWTKKREEIKGYLGSPGIFIHDEAQEVINEINQSWADCQRIKRMALDPYGRNWLDKKLVDQTFDDALAYMPECQIIDFIHKVKFSDKFFSTGSYRRYFISMITMEKNYELFNSVKGFYDTSEKESPLEKFKEWNMETPEEIEFTSDCIEEISKWVMNWNKFLLTHDNAKVRRYGEAGFYSTKEYFLKLAYLLHRINKKTKTEKALTTIACFDAIQFLLESLQVIIKYGNQINTSDTWNGAEGKEITVLEYLWRSGAKSLEDSKITISRFEQQIGEVFGLHDRQARSKFAELKEKGFVNSKKTNKKSTVWIAFEPRFGNIILRGNEQNKHETQQDDSTSQNELRGIKGSSDPSFDVCLLKARKTIEQYIMTHESILIQSSSSSFSNTHIQNRVGCAPIAPKEQEPCTTSKPASLPSQFVASKQKTLKNVIKPPIGSKTIIPVEKSVIENKSEWAILSNYFQGKCSECGKVGLIVASTGSLGACRDCFDKIEKRKVYNNNDNNKV